MAKKKAPKTAEERWFEVQLRVRFDSDLTDDDDASQALEDEVMRRIDHFREENGLADSTCDHVRRIDR